MNSSHPGTQRLQPYLIQLPGFSLRAAPPAWRSSKSLPWCGATGLVQLQGAKAPSHLRAAPSGARRRVVDMDLVRSVSLVPSSFLFWRDDGASAAARGCLPPSWSIHDHMGSLWVTHVCEPSASSFTARRRRRRRRRVGPPHRLLGRHWNQFLLPSQACNPLPLLGGAVAAYRGSRCGPYSGWVIDCGRRIVHSSMTIHMRHPRVASVGWKSIPFALAPWAPTAPSSLQDGYSPVIEL
jgi:hypothetical protein